MKQFFIFPILIFSSYLLFTGCATKSTDIEPADINASIREHHQSYNCNQLKQKSEFIDKKLHRMSVDLDEDSKDDRLIVATGWMLYGVPYLWLGGEKDNEKEYAQLLGLKEYLEELMIEKDCATNSEQRTATKQKNEFISTGTGFFVTSDGHLITNHHVISNANQIYVFTNDKQEFASRIIASDPINDIALLKIEFKSKPLPLTSATNAEKGQNVFTLGYPLITIQGNEQKATFGHINAKSGYHGDLRMMQVDVPIQPGNSGGPLLNNRGEVLGITTSSINSLYTLQQTGTLPQNINYAMKTDYIYPLLNQYIGSHWQTNTSTFEVDTDPTKLINFIADSVVLIVVYKRE